MREGWTMLANQKKAHYFREGRSLCGRWAYLDPDAYLIPDDIAMPEDCAGCRKKLGAPAVTQCGSS